MIAKTWKWMQIWLAIKPNLKCTQFSKYKKEYEDKIALAEANIDKAIAECDAVVNVHDRLVSEKGELNMALTSGGSMVQDIIDKTNRMETQKNDVQKQLDDVNKRVKGEEDLINSINQAGVKVTSDANRLREEIKNLECDCEKAEEDKSTKDNQIRTLREEIAHQEELIGKLQKEKKSKRDVEKMKRKIEGDLKLTQEAVSDLERVRSELQQTLMRKEKELSSVSAKIDDEATLGSKYAKQLKELQSRLEELD